MRRVLRWLIILLVVGGVGTVVVWGLRDWWARATRPHYQTATITRGKVETVVNSTGTVKPKRTVTVGAFVSGPVEKVYAGFNSVVKEDDLLAVIDPRLLKAAKERDEAAVATQQGEIERIRALLNQAVNNEKRAMQLREVNRDYISDQEIDQFHFNRQALEAQLRLAQATKKQAELGLENSTVNLSYTRIKAPVNGVVIERKVEPGQTVASMFQTPEMFIIGEDLDKVVHIYASADEADIGQIKQAQARQEPVRFTIDAYPQLVFSGLIKEVRQNSTTTSNVVTYPVIIEVPNTERKLMPGMTANITFTVDVRKDVARLPTAALRFSPPLNRVREQDRKYLQGIVTASSAGSSRMTAEDKAKAARARARRVVWVQEGDLLRAVIVRLGLIDGKFAELLSDELKEGDEVVTNIVNPLAAATEPVTLDPDE